MPPTASVENLQSLFLRFAAINGVSLEERLLADEIAALLRANGVRVLEDEAGKRLGGNTGNLICLPSDFLAGEPAIMLTAHLDTVQPTASLRTMVSNGRISSDGATILGADNRLGAAVLTHLLLSVALERRRHKNFFVVFTVAEELGMLGASQLDLTKFNVRCGYVFDCSQRPGVYIQKCAGAAVFRAKVLGKAAHAGVAPEEGINAIALAGAALVKIQTGRLDADTIVNVAKISGGKALNVVPDEVVVEGEVRGFALSRIHEQLDLIRRTFLQAVNGAGGRLEFDSRHDFAPYVLDAEAEVVASLENALGQVQLAPKPIHYMGGSDANVWNAKGIPAVNLGIGAQKPHSHEEFVLIEDLVKSAEIAFALVRPDEK
jgi:tripeptide aminopeptidase